MRLWETVAIGIGLSMDALAVSVTQGALSETHKRRAARLVLVAAFFGVFQAIMPLLGYYLGLLVTLLADIQYFSSWIAFALLLFLGAKMIADALRKKNGDEAKYAGLWELTLLAIATSIDALAVGVTYSLTDTANIWLNVILIGSVTFIICIGGGLAGLHLAKMASRRAGENRYRLTAIIGGTILILIGVKILLDGLLRF